MTPKETDSIVRLLRCMKLLSESLDSYVQHGDRVRDKVVNDLAMVAKACWEVAVIIGPV